MKKLFFFKSTYVDDEISGISVFTNNARKAFKLASKCFANNNCQGSPILINL